MVPILSRRPVKFYADKPDAPHPKSIGQTGCVDIVQRHGQFDRAQPGGEVPLERLTLSSK